MHSNDIYYSEGPESGSVFRLTNDSDPLIYNGLCDWIYEEEILSSNAVRCLSEFNSSSITSSRNLPTPRFLRHLK